MPHPSHISSARAALAALTEPQRLALVIEVINGAESASSELQLNRIAGHARRVADELGRTDFVEKEIRKCL